MVDLEYRKHKEHTCRVAKLHTPESLYWTHVVCLFDTLVYRIRAELPGVRTQRILAHRHSTVY